MSGNTLYLAINAASFIAVASRFGGLDGFAAAWSLLGFIYCVHRHVQKNP